MRARALGSTPSGFDEGDADLAAQAPNHLALPARFLAAGDQQFDLIEFGAR
jgi:hypothetical protein